VTRNCAVCGKRFEAKRSTAKYCGSTCRARQAQGIKPSRPARDVDMPAASVTPLVAENPLVAMVRRKLEDAGQLDTVLGQQAVMLAERLATQEDTGSAVAALSKELRAVMDAALKDAPKAADRVDELAERRRRKAAGV